MRAANYDDLIQGYYGGRRHGHHHRHRHRRPSDYGKPYRGREAGKDDHFLSDHYGHGRHHHHHHYGHAHEKQLFDLASSVDDGETLEQAGRHRQFEEYVVAASFGDTVFEEYVVDDAALSGQASLSDDQPLDPQTEYLVDVADPLGRTGDTNRFAPTPSGTAPASPAPTGKALPAPTAPAGAAAPSVAQPPASAPESAGHSTPESGAHSTPEDDFISDMKSILTRQKVYDPLSKKMVDADKLGQAASAESRPAQETSNSQAIFDKIAKSMQYANAYDLGTVELENRFADFDRMSDLQHKADSDKRTARARAKQAQDAVATATAVDSQDFIQDLDAMHHQRHGRRSDDDPFAYVPPEDPLGAQSPPPGAGWSGGGSPGAAYPGTGAGAEGGPPTSMPGMQMPNIQIPNIQIPNIQMPNIQMPGMPGMPGMGGPQTSAEQAASTSANLSGELVTSVADAVRQGGRHRRLLRQARSLQLHRLVQPEPGEARPMGQESHRQRGRGRRQLPGRLGQHSTDFRDLADQSSAVRLADEHPDQRGGRQARARFGARRDEGTSGNRLRLRQHPEYQGFVQRWRVQLDGLSLLQ
jgi:hypothetical protein